MKTNYCPGTYKTQLGQTAIVARLRASGPNWYLVGAISLNGVLYIHQWTILGKCLHGYTNYDLVRSL